MDTHWNDYQGEKIRDNLQLCFYLSKHMQQPREPWKQTCGDALLEIMFFFEMREIPDCEFIAVPETKRPFDKEPVYLPLDFLPP